MSSWILTLGLQNLRRQVDAAFPDRSRVSDGTIGDAAHAAEAASGHNPDDTPGSRPEWDGDPDTTAEVRAWDCTSDFGPGVNAQDVVDHLRTLPGLSTVLRYMIYNRRIYQAAHGWIPEPYTGASAHTEHIHFSGAYSQSADNNTTFNYRLEEVPVALATADKTWLSAEIRKQADAAVAARLDDIAKAVLVDYKLDGTQMPGSAYKRSFSDMAGDQWALVFRGNTRGGDPIPAGGVYEQILAQIADLAAKVDALRKPAA